MTRILAHYTLEDEEDKAKARKRAIAEALAKANAELAKHRTGGKRGRH